MGSELFLQFHLKELALADVLFTAFPPKICLRKTPIKPLKVTGLPQGLLQGNTHDFLSVRK